MKLNTLANKGFILVVIGQFISLFGNGILRFALPLYLLNITGSSAIFGMVSALSFLPLIVLMPIGGIIADRANKRNIMVVLDFITGLLMLFFYLFMDIITLVPLIATTLMTLYSISELYQPTVQASVPILLDDKVLTKGNGVVSSIGGLSNLLSPIIGGSLFGAYGITPIILVSIICFFASAMLELFIQIPHKKASEKTSMMEIVKIDTKLSINFIFREKPILKKLIYVACLLNAFISAMIIIALPVLITERLLLSKELYGVSQGILALGGLFGGVMTGVLGNKLKIQKLHQYLIFTGISLLPLSVSMFFDDRPMVAFVLILIGSFLVMCVATMVSVLIITYIQSQTTKVMVGKVMGFLMMISMLAQPLGQAIYGFAFEYTRGYEPFVMLGAVSISLFTSIYSKNIFR